MARFTVSRKRRAQQTPEQPEMAVETGVEMVDAVAVDAASEVALETAAVLGGRAIALRPPVSETPTEKKVPGV